MTEIPFDLPRATALLDRLSAKPGAVGYVDATLHSGLDGADREILASISRRLLAGEQTLRFAGMALEAMCGEAVGNDWDGGEVQDAMEACGLLAPIRVTEACDPETCICAEYGFPTTCFRSTPLAEQALAAAR